MDYKEQYEQLKCRLDHLMQSEFIRGFDAYDHYKKHHVRDIKLADEMAFGKNNNTTVNVFAQGMNEILEITREIASNMERAVIAKEKLEVGINNKGDIGGQTK